MSNTKTVSIQPRNRRLQGTYGRGFRRRLHGFTLIELLVVVSIIALLVAILVPSLQEARERARSVTCLANERSIGLSILMYANDYGGWLLPQGRPPIYLINLDYVEISQFLCPSDTILESDFLPGWWDMSYMFSNMVFPSLLDPNSLPTKLSMFERPFNDFLMVDSDWPPFANEYQGYPHFIFLTISTFGTNEYNTTRHSGGSNCLFGDGHVEWMTPQDYQDKFWLKAIGDFHPGNGYDFTM